MEKKIKIDLETINMVKEYINVLIQEQGIKYSQGNAVKIALRKVLFK